MEGLALLYNIYKALFLYHNKFIGIKRIISNIFRAVDITSVSINRITLDCFSIHFILYFLSKQKLRIYCSDLHKDLLSMQFFSIFGVIIIVVENDTRSFLAEQVLRLTSFSTYQLHLIAIKSNFENQSFQSCLCEAQTET